jgi:O-antigen/teichoic acid export membrane protein
MVGLMIGGGAWACTPSLIGLAFGADYTGAVPATRVMSLAIPFVLVWFYCWFALVVAKREQIVFWISAASAGVLLLEISLAGRAINASMMSWITLSAVGAAATLSSTTLLLTTRRPSQR